MKLKSRKIISLALVFFMMLTILPMAPVTAHAAGVVEVDTYEELYNAVYGKETNIRLTKDISYECTEESPIWANIILSFRTNTVLDLNGHELKFTNKNDSHSKMFSFICIAKEDVTVTIRNGDIIQDNLLEAAKDPDSRGPIEVTAGTLITEKVNITNKKGGHTVYAKGDVTVNLKGGTIETWNGYAVYTYGAVDLTLDQGVVLKTRDGNGHTTNHSIYYGCGSLFMDECTDSTNLSLKCAILKNGVTIESDAVKAAAFDIASHTIYIGENKVTKPLHIHATGEEISIPADKYEKSYWGSDDLINISDVKYSFNVSVTANDYKREPLEIAITTPPNKTQYAVGEKFDPTGMVVRAYYIDGTEADVTDYEINDPDQLLNEDDRSIDIYYGGKWAYQPITVYPNLITELSAEVEPPAVDKTPATTATTEDDGYTVTVYEWLEMDGGSEKTVSDKFEADKTYKVVIAFEAESEYTLADNRSVTINGKTATLYGFNGDALHYAITFDKLTAEPDDTTKIDELSATVSGHDAGAATKDATVAAGGTGYTATILNWYDTDSWINTSDENKMGADDKFVAGKTYMVEVKFTPEAGYEFAGIGISATINGNNGFGGGFDDGGKIYRAAVTVPAGSTEPASAHGVKATISDVDFGTLNVGYSSPEAVKPTITNTGTEEFYLTRAKVELTAGDTTDFSCGWNSGPGSINVGGSSNSKPWVRPTTGLTAGTYTATLTLYYDYDGQSETTYDWEIMDTCTVTLKVSDSTTPTEYDITVTGGTASANKAVAGTVITLTVDESAIPAGKVFDKWEVVSDGVTVTDGKFTMPESAVEIKATYKDAPVIPTEYDITITGGTASANKAVAGTEITLTVDNSAIPAGKVFDKWEVVSGGVTVADGKFTMPESAVEIKATYKDKPSSGSSSGGGFSGSYNYPVIIGDTDGADVAVSDEHATKGEKITITVKPDGGKQVDEVIVTDKDGKVIPVTKTGDNEYTFTMPASKVTVDVTTEAADYGLRIVMQINNKNILVNGKTMVNDVAPVIVADRTLVPIRVVTELLGGSAHWDNATRTVTLNIDGKVLSMTIGKPIPGFGTSAVIMNDRTYVPVRYVMEKLGAEVEWINATRQIIIEK